MKFRDSLFHSLPMRAARLAVGAATLFAAALFPTAPFATVAAADETVDFRRDVRPILSEHCAQCHGPDDKTREGGLRLDLRDAALAKLESGSIPIVPGNPDASAIMARITATDPELIMPPAAAQKPLSAAQVDALKRWIAQGAPYAGHWSFDAPTRPAVPSLPAPMVKNSIDAFVIDRLAREGLSPSPAAPPAVLCRRIHLDLIGLPPSPRDIEEFTAAAQQDLAAAVDALTTRLLASPQYGEKWTRIWLDAARYADSNGYEKDLQREQWAWRDWVINAFNADMPYDEFVVSQVAGDLVARERAAGSPPLSPLAAQDLVVATGFMRNGMINEEGAIVPEEFRMESMYDRLDCLGKAVLGLSVQCGQCHSHKFDPLAHSEYYGLFAFLNNTYEAQSWVYTPEQLDKIEAIRAGTAAIEQRLREQTPDWQTRFDAWQAEELTRQRAIDWRAIEAIDMHSSTELNHPVQLADKSILTLGHRTNGGDLYAIAQHLLPGTTSIRVEVLTHGDLPFNGPGRSDKGLWALTELIVESQKPGETAWEKLKLQNATADFSEPDHPLEPEWQKGKDDKRKCGPAAFAVDASDETAWRADRGAGRRNADSVLAAQFEKPLDLPEGTKLKISLRTAHDGPDGFKNVMIGRFRISLTAAADAKVSATPYGAVLALQTPVERRTPEQQAAIFAAWRQTVPEFQPLNEQIDSLWREYPQAPTSILHIAERNPDLTRATHRLERGSWMRPQEVVAPHVPAALHPLAARRGGEAGATPDRLDFARWLVDRRSPLAARVAVNRVWQTLFGAGLVETAEDFGTRAAAPEHEALLDWLAVEFMDGGWSHKKLLRAIVSSATYQQTSSVSPAQLERDPRNRLYARGPRFRIDAEGLRDVALGVSGLLHLQVGGPSVFPPVPASVLDDNFTRPGYWIPPEGPQRYRRGLYLFRKRAMPDPVLTAFDAPNADFACARRPRSNTPLAALVSLNETVFVESARALALRVLAEGGAADAERIDYAFRLCTGRPARPAEIETVLAMLAEHRQRIADGWLSAREIATGDPARLPVLPPHATPQDAAAWTLAARVLLNLDETLTKN